MSNIHFRSQSAKKKARCKELADEIKKLEEEARGSVPVVKAKGQHFEVVHLLAGDFNAMVSFVHPAGETAFKRVFTDLGLPDATCKQERPKYWTAGEPCLIWENCKHPRIVHNLAYPVLDKYVGTVRGQPGDPHNPQAAIVRVGGVKEESVIEQRDALSRGPIRKPKVVVT